MEKETLKSRCKNKFKMNKIDNIFNSENKL